MKAVKLFRSYEDPSEDPQYSEVMSQTLLQMLGALKGSFMYENR